MAWSRIIGSKRLARIDAATNAPTAARPSNAAIPASQYFLRGVTRSYPNLWMVLGTDCFLKLRAQGFLVGAKEKAIRHPGDVIADHAVNGPMLERFQVIPGQLFRMRDVEFEQFRDHRG